MDLTPESGWHARYTSAAVSAPAPAPASIRRIVAGRSSKSDAMKSARGAGVKNCPRASCRSLLCGFLSVGTPDTLHYVLICAIQSMPALANSSSPKADREEMIPSAPPSEIPSERAKCQAFPPQRDFLETLGDLIVSRAEKRKRRGEKFVSMAPRFIGDWDGMEGPFSPCLNSDYCPPISQSPSVADPDGS